MINQYEEACWYWHLLYPDYIKQDSKLMSFFEVWQILGSLEMDANMVWGLWSSVFPLIWSLCMTNLAPHFIKICALILCSTWRLFYSKTSNFTWKVLPSIFKVRRTSSVSLKMVIMLDFMELSMFLT